jgi:hypothetical protein
MPLDAKALADATAEIVTRHVAQATAPLLKRIELLEARPAPEKGDKGDPGESIKGETGVGLAGALIDRSGVLVLTLSDGTTRDLGPVVGKDGTNGQDGADGLPGEPGKDGADGFGLDDFDCQPVDERTIKLMFTRGETCHSYELEFPVTIYRDVFKAGETYARGDAVTWGGSLWIAQKETDAKPDSPESGWKLAVKKGRDGKDAK